MTTLSPPEATEILSGLGDVKAGLATLASEVHLHGEILGRIVELLTPDDEPSGPRLHELLAALIGRLDRQTAMLKEILEAQRNLRRALPDDVTHKNGEASETGGAGVHGAAGGETHRGNGQAAPHRP